MRHEVECGVIQCRMRNLITDVAGLKVGHAEDLHLGSGATVVVFDEPAVALDRCARRRAGHARNRACSIRRRRSRASTPLRCPAARPSASMPLPASKRGSRSRSAALPCAPRVVPIVPAAILFDLLSGGDKNWGRFPPYRDLGYAAAVAAATELRARQRRRRHRRDHGQLQRRPRLRLGARPTAISSARLRR